MGSFYYYWTRLTRKFLMSKLTQWALISSIAFMFSLLASRALAQSSNVRTGLAFEGINQLNRINLTTFQYTGECPGTTDPVVEAWFTSATTPPAEDRRVVIRNVTTGTDPDDQPYTDREYDEGTFSESFNIEFGAEHSRRRFRVLRGDNQFQYEIEEDRNVIESGSFTATFGNTVQSEERNSTLQTRQVCANSSVALNVCADVRTNNQWKCPNGSVVRQTLEPDGPVRTVISNQTFDPISYELGGRIY